jgi:hypothetical protein
VLELRSGSVVLVGLGFASSVRGGSATETFGVTTIMFGIDLDGLVMFGTGGDKAIQRRWWMLR